MTAYKTWLKATDKTENADGTCKTKLSHIKTFLKVSYGIEVYTKFFGKDVEQVRPHKAYEEKDIFELIAILKAKVEEQKTKESAQNLLKPNNGSSHVQLARACK